MRAPVMGRLMEDDAISVRQNLSVMAPPYVPPALMDTSPLFQRACVFHALLAKQGRTANATIAVVVVYQMRLKHIASCAQLVKSLEYLAQLRPARSATLDISLQMVSSVLLHLTV